MTKQGERRAVSHAAKPHLKRCKMREEVQRDRGLQRCTAREREDNQKYTLRAKTSANAKNVQITIKSYDRLKALCRRDKAAEEEKMEGEIEGERRRRLTDGRKEEVTMKREGRRRWRKRGGDCMRQEEGMKGGRRDERKELEETEGKIEDERYTQRGRKVGGRQEKEMRKRGGIDKERRLAVGRKEEGG
ncbi:hypothetical protein NQZ68_035106 [Dissostichus eleginoides]|nr:hypothetical protein NQZ68_035106 [Dissostichus eleginoides]